MLLEGKTTGSLARAGAAVDTSSNINIDNDYFSGNARAGAGTGLRRINSNEFQELMDANIALVNWEDGGRGVRTPETAAANGDQSGVDGDANQQLGLGPDANFPSLGLRNAIYTLTGSIVGAGAISCPFAFSFMGSIGGMLMLASMGFLSGYCGYLLGIAARKTGLFSYESIAVHTLGPRAGKGLALSSVIGVTFCATIAYMNLWADLTLPIIQVIFGVSDAKISQGTDKMDFYCLRTLVIMVCGCCIFPLCIQREIAGVAFASLLSIIAMGILTLVIVRYLLIVFD